MKSISVRRPASTSWRMDELLLAVARITARMRSRSSASDRLTPSQESRACSSARRGSKIAPGAERVDGAVDRQLEPEHREYVAFPAPVDTGTGEPLQPVRGRAGGGVTDQGLPGTGPDHLVGAAQPGAIGDAGVENAVVGKPAADGLLAAQAVLQKQYLAVRRESVKNAVQGIGHRPGLGRYHQQAYGLGGFVGQLPGDFQRCALALLLEQQQVVALPPGADRFPGSQYELAGNTGQGSACGQQQPQAAGPQNVQRVRQAGESALR